MKKTIAIIFALGEFAVRYVAAKLPPFFPNDDREDFDIYLRGCKRVRAWQIERGMQNIAADIKPRKMKVFVDSVEKVAWQTKPGLETLKITASFECPICNVGAKKQFYVQCTPFVDSGTKEKFAMNAAQHCATRQFFCGIEDCDIKRRRGVVEQAEKNHKEYQQLAKELENDTRH